MFIKLTRINIANGAEQGDVYLNPDQIESIGLAKRGVAGERKAHTVVLMAGCAEYYVAESIEDILGQINNAAQEELLPKIRFINGEAVEVRG